MGEINNSNVVDRMMQWETGKLDKQATVELFQHLIDTGFVLRLHGVYGRTAKALIDAGLCKRREEWDQQ